MTSRVFISYRRSDQPALAHWLCRELSIELGADDVFLDVKALEAGQQFPKRLRQALNQSLVVVVMIGPQWNPMVKGSTRRLDDPTNFVRLEVELALRNKETDPKRMILPVVFDGADVPASATLPTSLRGLSELHAQILSSNSYEQGISSIVSGVVQRLDTLEAIPAEEAWILRQITDTVAIGRERVRRLGLVLHSRFSHIKAPESPRALAKTLYRIGPDALDCLTPLRNRDGSISMLLDLLATNWIEPGAARSLRTEFTGAKSGAVVAIDCDYADFTPREALLKASGGIAGWPTVSIKPSDNTEEILGQIHEALLLEFSAELRARRGKPAAARSESEERAELCEMLARYREMHHEDLPMVLQLDHRTALDGGLIQEIKREFPPLNVLIASSDPEEIPEVVGIQTMVEPSRSETDEQRALESYSRAARKLRRLGRD